MLRKTEGRARCNALGFFLMLTVLLSAITCFAAPRHGVGVGIPMHTEQIEQVSGNGAKFVRHFIFIDPNYVEAWNWPSYLNATLFALDFLDYNCADYRARGIEVMITLAYYPGGRNGSGFNLFKKNHWGRQAFKDMWEYIAKRYAWDSCVMGFDLMNEPRNSTKQIQSLMNETTALMRRYTYQKIIAHTSREGHCSYMNELKPVSDPYVWYTCHVYDHHYFTHQGIDNGEINVKGGQPYPTSSFNKKTLANVLSPAAKLAKKIGAQRIYIGEGAVSIYADQQSRLNWTRDVVELTKDYNTTLYFSGQQPGQPNVFEPDSEVWKLILKYK